MREAPDEIVDLAPSDWDTRPLRFVARLKDLLAGIADGEIDTGGGDGSADLWVSVDGIEFYINVRPSKTQTKQAAH
jgi:hypothetical protein